MNDCSVSNRPLVKRCRVCGDKALGFNFNGLSCESCKAFFRRNALRHEEYSCSRKGNCKIDRLTRKNCQYCRLNKCFAIGMRKELIFTTKEEKESDDCKEEQEKHFKVTHPRKAEKNKSVSDIQVVPLRSYESRCIEEIQSASAVLFDEIRARSVGETKSLCDIINFSGWYPRRVISFAQKLPSFRNLDQNDQLVIIKESFPDVMITLTAFNYNWKNDSFPLATTESGEEVINVKLCSMYESKTKSDIRTHRRFVRQFQREMERDLVVRNLVNLSISPFYLVLFFSPRQITLILMFSSRSTVACQHYIRYYFFFYCHLMRRYFEQKYNSTVKCSEKFDRVMKLLDRLIIQKSTIVEIFAQLDSSKITQLMAEILNIK